MQYSLIIANNSVANDEKAINVKVGNKIIKIYNIRGPYVVFEVDYVWND